MIKIILLLITLFSSTKEEIQINQVSTLEQLQSGIFTCVDDYDEMGKMYEDYKDRFQEMYVDLNEDGIEDLIWFDSSTICGEQIRIIYAIFLCFEDKATCIRWDMVDITEYMFLSENGNIVSTAHSGGVFNNDGFTLMKVIDGKLQPVLAAGVDDFTDPEGWLTHRCVRYDENGDRIVEYVTVDEFLKTCKEITGFEYDYSRWENWVPQERIYRTHARQEVVFTPDTSGNNDVPQGLIDYLSKSLKDNTLIDDLKEIECDYREMNKDESKALLEQSYSQGSKTFRSFEDYYVLNEDNVWYQVKLSDTVDIVVVNELYNTGLMEIYYFKKSPEGEFIYEPALVCGGQKNSTAYFVEWESKNYLIVPYWSDEQKIVGVCVNNFGEENTITTLGIGKNGEVNICHQIYNADATEGSEEPVVLVD